MMVYYDKRNTIENTYSDVVTIPPSKTGYSAVIKIKAQVGEAVVISRTHLFVTKT